MYFHTVEESFDHDHMFAWCHAMQVEQHIRFSKSGWQFVFRFGLIDCTTGVRDEFSHFVMNRNDHASTHRSTTRKESAAEVNRGFFFYSATPKIRMGVI